jgi:oligopeptide/dipeptide ABC transporter ATP-binding protein
LPFDRLHQDRRPLQRAHDVMVDLLEKVQIPDPERVLKQYPHELSGGMRQRVCIAMAVSARPQLVIADEPTTALDVTTQAAVLELLQKLMEESGSALLFVSHDLAVVGRICERVAVMYAGVIVESGKTEHVLASPHHPYTQGLLDSIPRMTDRRDEQYRTIEGTVPSPAEHITGCPFAARCSRASDQCHTAMPDETVSDGHMYRCWHPLREAQ